MKLTPEQIQSNADAVRAWLEGRDIESLYIGPSSKFTSPYWGQLRRQIDNPSWDFQRTLYRPKPEPKPKTRAWSNPDDVPGPICWLRVKEKPSGHYMPLSIWWDGIALHFKGEGYFLSWQKLAEKCEYSTDRKTWHKCEVVEP